MPGPLLALGTLLALQEAPVREAFLREPDMTTGSWIFMILAWIFVTALLVWAFRRVLGEPPGPTDPDIAGPPGG